MVNVASLPGVSGFQLHFADHDILTPGDQPDVLVAMNPAALKTNLRDLPKSGTLIVDTDAFTDRNPKKAGYESNPIEDGSLDAYQLHAVQLTSMTVGALKELEGVTAREAERSKNMFALAAEDAAAHVQAAKNVAAAAANKPRFRFMSAPLNDDAPAPAPLRSICGWHGTARSSYSAPWLAVRFGRCMGPWTTLARVQRRR